MCTFTLQNNPSVRFFSGTTIVVARNHSRHTVDQPSYLEKTVARGARNLAIPRRARLEATPWKSAPEVIQEARESFLDRLRGVPRRQNHRMVRRGATALAGALPVAHGVK
jgi:hypothetical protein